MGSWCVLYSVGTIISSNVLALPFVLAITRYSSGGVGMIFECMASLSVSFQNKFIAVINAHSTVALFSMRGLLFGWVIAYAFLLALFSRPQAWERLPMFKRVLVSIFLRRFVSGAMFGSGRGRCFCRVSVLVMGPSSVQGQW